MEENENVENVENVETSNVTSEETKKGGFLKNKKMLIIVAIVAVIAIIILFNVFGNTKGKAKNVVKQYVKAMDNCDAKKMIKLVDPYGAYVFGKLDEDDYEDFWDEYKEFVKEKDDDYDDVKESYKESLEKDNIKDAKEALEDIFDDAKIKIKKISSVKKVGKNLYKVKAKIEMKSDDDKETESQDFYVMKKGTSCYIVSGAGAF